MDNLKTEHPELTSTLEEIAFMLQEDPDAVNTFAPRDIVHALEPSMNVWRKALPVGTTLADMWIVRNGDPLLNMTAAAKLSRIVAPETSITTHMTGDDYTSATIEGPGIIVKAEASTGAAAILAALLTYVLESGHGQTV